MFQPFSVHCCAGIKLKLSEEAVSSAAVFYHTFYSVMTKENYDPNVRGSRDPV